MIIMHGRKKINKISKDVVKTVDGMQFRSCFCVYPRVANSSNKEGHSPYKTNNGVNPFLGHQNLVL